MYETGHYAEMKGVPQTETNYAMFENVRSINKHKDPMFGCFNGGDISI
jgi:hypothetical protein